MRIDRWEMIERLRAFALEDHGVITGAPGVGKTVAVSQLADRLLQEGRGAILIGVDDLGDATVESVRLALPFRDSLDETLGAYFEDRHRPGVLIVDGFDAARDPVVRQRVLGLIHRLIRSANNRWHVLVTVRVYDAEKSPDLLSLFRQGARATAASRHMEVPRLEVSELEAVLGQVPGLPELYEAATSGLRDLLRLPFHLWLTEQVLHAAEPAERAEAVGTLSHVETEVQLLDRFWRARVTGGRNGPALATLARRASEAMVRGQSLSVPAPEVWTPEMEHAWEELLSAEVFTLSGPAQSRVGFGHNILFDYATSLYVLSDDPALLERFLLQAPARALFLRPSLVYLFAHLWEERRHAFWRLFQALARLDELPIRLVSRLIPPVVLASGARAVEELSPLDEAGWRDREQVLLWVLQAVRFSSDSRSEIWSEFVSRLAVDPTPTYAWEAAGLLRVLLAREEERAERDVVGQEREQHVRSFVGVAARRMLRKALSNRGDPSGGRHNWWDTFGANQALPLVLDTMGSDPASSADVMRPVLDLIREPEVPIRYFLAVSRGIATIIRHDPSLAAHIYRVVFGHVELSEETTSMGGVVLRLNSTRRQDFEMVQYSLVKAFPRFLEVAPREAIPAGLVSGSVDIVRTRVLRHLKPKELDGFLEERTRSMHFRGKDLQWIEDHSVIWRHTRREDGPELIRAAADHVGRLARTDADTTSDVLDDYAVHAQVAFAWARLLRVGARSGPALAKSLRELATQRAVQESMDLREALGEFPSAAPLHWDRDERAEVERSIWSVVADETSRLSVEQRERLRDQLLAALPGDTLVTTEARARMEGLRAAGEAPTIEPPVQFHVQSSRYTHDDWLRDQGVNPESPENRQLGDQVSTLENLKDAWHNKIPPADAVEQIEDALPSAMQAVDGSEEADPLVRRHAWTVIAGAAEAVARSPDVEGDDRWGRIRDILLRALEQPGHEVDEGADEEFSFPAWSPSPQTEAIQGLGSMLWKRLDEEILPHYERILLSARDPVLRFLASQYMLGLHRHDAERYWIIAQALAAREANAVIATELLRGLSHLVWSNAQRVREIVEVLWARWHATEHKNLLEGFAVVVLVLAAHARDEWAEALLDEARGDPLTHQELLGQIHFEAAAALTPEVACGPRRPHIERLVEILVLGIAALGRADEALHERQANGETLADERGRIHQMVENVASRVDLNLRYDSALRGDQDDEIAEARAEQAPMIASYYRLIWPVVEAVLTFGERSQMLIASAAHHLLELFNVLLKADPRTVIVAANRAVQAGRGDNYNLDSMAIREVVHLMETVMADHRDILLDGESMQAGLELLDTFAQAGWTEALQLIWRLDEVFR